jgi:hypothetical protein
MSHYYVTLKDKFVVVRWNGVICHTETLSGSGGNLSPPAITGDGRVVFGTRNNNRLYVFK